MLRSLLPLSIIFAGLKGNCTLAMKDSDFMDLVTGKLGAQKVRLHYTRAVMYIYRHCTH